MKLLIIILLMMFFASCEEQDCKKGEIYNSYVNACVISSCGKNPYCIEGCFYGNQETLRCFFNVGKIDIKEE